MFEEDIFGEDSVTLVLRYGDYVIQSFDKKSKVVTFDKLKAILAGKEMPCFFFKKRRQTAHHFYPCVGRRL